MSMMTKVVEDECDAENLMPDLIRIQRFLEKLDSCFRRNDELK